MVCFSVSVNKGQGQENDRVGIYLPKSVFSHGQLYTSMSRAKRQKSVKVYIEENEEGFTKNIVYSELIWDVGIPTLKDISPYILLNKILNIS